MSDIEGLRALAEGATPGPWTAMYGGVVHSLREAFHQAVIYNVPCACGEDVNHVISEDAAYIAAASPDVALGLLDRLAAAERAIDRVRRLHPRGDEESSILAPGLWCPTCGRERSEGGNGSCPERKALSS